MTFKSKSAKQQDGRKEGNLKGVVRDTQVIHIYLNTLYATLGCIKLWATRIVMKPAHAKELVMATTQASVVVQLVED
eukprot:5298247-Amphidinium_carterae.1